MNRKKYYLEMNKTMKKSCLQACNKIEKLRLHTFSTHRIFYKHLLINECSRKVPLKGSFKIFYDNVKTEFFVSYRRNYILYKN